MSEPSVNEELGDLLAKALDSGLSASEGIRLSSLLAADAEARRFFHDYLDLHTDLRWSLAPESLQLPSGIESLVSESPNQHPRTPRPNWIARLSVGLAAAAVITAAILLPRPDRPPGEAGDPPPRLIARITLDEDATWLEPSDIPRDGDWLGQGTIRLSSGRLGITFASGARLMLDGPAEFDINSADRAFLRTGRITAQVPTQAIGFLIGTPNGNILDLGTEFSVDVASGRSQVEVTEGKVKAYATDGAGEDVERIIHEDEAVALAADTASPIQSIDPLAGRTRIDWSRLQVPEFLDVRYTFDEESEPYLNSGSRPRPFPGTTGNHWGGETRPDVITGPFGRALSFGGDGGCVTTPFPGIGGGRPRTVAFWIKLPPNVRGRSGQAVVSWGAPLPGNRWQIGWNNNHGWGAIGAIRTDFFGGFVTGTTDLRDGRWHHVASVFIGGRWPDVASHVLHYVDGRLEGVSGRKSKRIDTRVKQPESSTLLLGVQVNDGSERVAFLGALDELHIFDAALLPEQIMQLKDANQAVRPEPVQE